MSDQQRKLFEEWVAEIEDHLDEIEGHLDAVGSSLDRIEDHSQKIQLAAKELATKMALLKAEEEKEEVGV
jgi:phage shock protein A